MATAAGASLPALRHACEGRIALRPATSPFAGARSRAMLLLHYKAKSFRLPSQPSHFLLAWPTAA